MTSLAVTLNMLLSSSPHKYGCDLRGGLFFQL